MITIFCPIHFQTSHCSSAALCVCMLCTHIKIYKQCLCFYTYPYIHSLICLGQNAQKRIEQLKSTKILYVESQMALTSQTRLTRVFLAPRSNTAPLTQGSNVCKRGRCWCAGPLSTAHRSPTQQQPQQRVGQR